MLLCFFKYLPVLLVTSFLGARSEEIDLNENAKEEVFDKLKQKQLISRTVRKPEHCSVVSEVGDELQIHYKGYLENGQMFDSSEKQGQTHFTFTIGAGELIPGCDQGLLGMCEGEQRRLVIPPWLGYGKVGYPPVIPPDATLMFEVTLISLKKKNSQKSFASLEGILHFLKFMTPPLVVVFVIYYLYTRYKKETEADNELKHGKKKGKNN
ncbi:uncharacterized protein LOC131930604 [Physella acuta]|uniref:uncharacterized protein LOC131930604 n=1 Tax=Physella acuta TaxID=109671 RepID=UPI0027DBF086|nr:uncharacterized protein LOC131930604 [Physella acuta]